MISILLEKEMEEIHLGTPQSHIFSYSQNFYGTGGQYSNRKKELSPETWEFSVGIVGLVCGHSSGVSSWEFTQE